jgi:hypothetical protein
VFRIIRTDNPNTRNQNLETGHILQVHEHWILRQTVLRREGSRVSRHEWRIRQLARQRDEISPRESLGKRVVALNACVAEREGFEPSVEILSLRRFSKPLPSATRPPLHITMLWGDQAHIDVRTTRRVEAPTLGGDLTSASGEVTRARAKCGEEWQASAEPLFLPHAWPVRAPNRGLYENHQLSVRQATSTRPFQNPRPSVAGGDIGYIERPG